MLARKARDLFLKSVEKPEYGSLRLELPDGVVHRFEGRKPGPNAHLRLYSDKVFLHAAMGGDVAFVEDYRNGLCDSDDLALLVEFFIGNEDSMRPFMEGGALRRAMSRLSYFLHRNTRAGSRRNIHAHYDLGNAFYRLWLDPSMTYSSAIFAAPGETLQQGQHNKYDRILERIGGKAQKVLEIGCGWGGFAERAIDIMDHRVSGLTISQAQYDYACERLRDAGDQANIRMQDYRDHEGRYDAIVSIEMFEAVGEAYWPTYFRKVASLLKENGRAVIQTITIGDDQFPRYRKSADAIRSYVFPGGMLPSPSRFIREARQAGLEPTGRFSFGQDYARTLLCWRENFENSLDQVRALGFDEPFIRLWRLYLSFCAGGFSSGKTDVIQMELRRA